MYKVLRSVTLQKRPQLFSRFRWKLYIVILILAIITVAQAMLGFLLVGHVVPSYSTLKDSWITGWLLSTAKWNLRYVDHRSPRPLPLALALIAVSVLLWVFVFHSLVRCFLSDRHTHVKTNSLAPHKCH